MPDKTLVMEKNIIIIENFIHGNGDLKDNYPLDALFNFIPRTRLPIQHTRIS
jgi:hypothetical protein